jgi:undecaprenyl-diphosphatase
MTRRGVGAGALGLLGFLLLVVLVSVHPGPLPLDRTLHRLAVQHRAPIVGAAETATDLGTEVVILPLLLLAGMVFAQRHGRRWWLALAGPALLSLGQLLRFLIMEAVARPRPSRVDWIRYAAGWSFPSGHTTTSALGYGLIVLLVSGSIPRRGLRLLVAMVLLGVAGCVGASRVVLGVHWPTDVLGGWSLALVLAVVSAAVLQRLTGRARLRADELHR